MSKKVAIVGHGVVGQAYNKMFPDAVIYDEPKAKQVEELRQKGYQVQSEVNYATRQEVNDCDLAIVAVFTALKEDNTLDTSIVEEVVGWLETPLILIKSALHPGTTDRLVKKTGKKIAVSVEYIGEGNYPVHYWKYPHQNDPRLHQMLIVGGEPKVAEACAEILWSRMSPDINIQLTSALEAEITKLVENAYGSLKVTFINALMSLAQKSDSSFLNIHQAWQADPRTDSMHLRAVTFNRGWVSKCWDKDVPALVAYAKAIGASDMEALFQTVLDVNKYHLGQNE